MIYFDNGATSFPKPRQVAAAVSSAFNLYGANPGRSGHEMSMNTAIKVFEAREAIADLFKVQNPQEVVFTLNCTHAVNMALKGALRTGDHVIISDLEHNAVLRPIHALARSGVITYNIAETFPEHSKTIASFARYITPNTKMIACTHASNVFGIVLPIEGIAQLCKERNIMFLVDAAQTAGVLELKPRCWGIDFLCAAGHKGLYGPSGTGVLVTPHGSSMETIIEGGTGSFSASYEQPDEMPDRFESGTINTMGVLGLGAGVRFVRDKTVEEIYTHEIKLTLETLAALRDTPGIELYTPSFGFGTHVPVLPFNIEGKSSEETTALLSDKGFALRGGLHCAPLAHYKFDTLERGCVRASFGAFNTIKQVNRLCEAIAEIARG